MHLRTWAAATLLGTSLALANLASVLVASADETKRPPHTLEGLASWYGRGHHGLRTSSGERFDMRALTAAHNTLPFGSRVRVTDVDSGRSVVVRISDRGPHVAGRIIDLSLGAGRLLGIIGAGVARVRLEVLAPAWVRDVVHRAPAPRAAAPDALEAVALDRSDEVVSTAE
jgi:rare lipoprotein A